MFLPPTLAHACASATPGGQSAAIQSHEEGIGGTPAANIRASLTCYRRLPRSRPEVQLHDITVWGEPASADLFLHLKSGGCTGRFDNYAESFEWAAARP